MIREKRDGCKSYDEIYAKEKKMSVKQMVEVKNTYEIMGVEQTVDLIKKKKGCKEWILEVINNNFSYWTNGRFDQRKKIRVEVCNKEKEKKCAWNKW